MSEKSIQPRKLLIRAIKLGIAALALSAVGYYSYKTWGDLQSREVELAFHPGWLLVAMALHTLGSICYAMNYWRILDRGQGHVGFYPAIRAHIIGHLAKYVPGKALVVIVRVGLVRPFGPRIAPAAWAAMYETLTMMAAGGLMAALGFLSTAGIEQSGPLAIGGLIGLGLTGLALPPIFRRLAQVASMPFPQVSANSLPDYNLKVMTEGLGWSAAGWLFWGLSQAAVLAMLGVSVVDPGAWPLVLASVALATVAGFAVAVLPGGLGVREWVLMITLQVALGNQAIAVVSALALRLVWVGNELLIAGLLYVLRPAHPVAEPEPSPAPDATLTSPSPNGSVFAPEPDPRSAESSRPADLNMPRGPATSPHAAHRATT